MVGKDAYHIKICLHPFHVLLANKILSCSGANSLFVGICHMYRKPIDDIVCVAIGQVLINVRAKDANKRGQHQRGSLPS